MGDGGQRAHECEATGVMIVPPTLCSLLSSDASVCPHPSQLANIEFATVQNEVLKSLEQGNAALARCQSQMSLEDAERIMDENADVTFGATTYPVCMVSTHGREVIGRALY